MWRLFNDEYIWNDNTSLKMRGTQTKFEQENHKIQEIFLNLLCEYLIN